jgi:hypothetical protein
MCIKKQRKEVGRKEFRLLLCTPKDILSYV